MNSLGMHPADEHPVWHSGRSNGILRNDFKEGEMKTTRVILVVLAMLLLAAPAVGDEALSCETDADCPDGYFCIYLTTACVCPDCPPGEECEDCNCPDEGEVEGYCEQEDWDDDDDWGFYGGECDEDADCPVGFACEMVPVPCAAPDCPPCTCEACDPDDEDCNEEPDCECPDCPDPEPCEAEEVGYCVYDMVDCETDADCAAGFECLEVEECSGSGGGCSCGCDCMACPEGEDCPDCVCPPCDCEEEEYTEECEVVGSFCAPKEQPCEDDADCLDGWECMTIAVGGGDTDCACPACLCEPCPEGEECEPCDCPDCDCGDEEPETFVEEEGYCVPAGWSEIIEESAMGGANYEEARDAMAGELYGDGAEDGADKSVQIATPEAPGDGAAEDSSSSGCATGQAAGAAPLFILLAALAAAILPRRRTSR